MKRTVIALLFAALVVPVLAWLTFPLYIQSIIDRKLQGAPFHVQLSNVGLPGPFGVGFGRLTLAFTADPDECSRNPVTYRFFLTKGSFSWNITALDKAFLPNSLHINLQLKADSLHLRPNPADFLFEDTKPGIDITLKLLRRKNAPMEIQPVTVSYPIDNASVVKEKLRLEGLRYKLFLAHTNNWQQPRDTLKVARVYTDGNPAPITNFMALFGSKRDSLKPCTLTLSNCSVDVFKWKAISEKIEYDLRERWTRFTLQLTEVPLDSLPWLKDSKRSVIAKGKLSGSIPIEFRDSTLQITNASVRAENGSRVLFLTKEKKPWISVAVGQRENDRPLHGLNATITLNSDSKNKNLSGVAVRNFSTSIFGGELLASPFLFDRTKNEMRATLTAKNIAILERLTFHDGSLRGTLKGAVSGTIPLLYGKQGLSVGNPDIASTIGFSGIPLHLLPGLNGNNRTAPEASGTASGTIPLVYRNNTLTIQNGQISGSKGSTIKFYNKEKQPWLSVDLASKPGGIVNNISAAVTFSGPENDRFRNVFVRRFSAGALGGRVQSTPFSSGDIKKGMPLTLTLNKVNLLDRLRFHGDLKGSLKGAVSGTIPLLIRENGWAVRNAHLVSDGGGTITIAPPVPRQTVTERIFGPPRQDAEYTFSTPDLYISRYYDAETLIRFRLKELKRKTQSGELLLTSPKGTLTMWKNKRNPDLITISDFKTGFFDGTASVDKADYDLAKKETRTNLQFSGISLQKLLDLQGTKKIYATGTLKGTIPITMKNQVFSIDKGVMNAETTGQIIYSTTPEERAAAHQSLRTTYEALSNFLYVNLKGDVSMESDGKSVISLELKGNNPDFQGGRPVNLNLTVQQNLLDLMRSFSISSNIEQIISEKALEMEQK